MRPDGGGTEAEMNLVGWDAPPGFRSGYAALVGRPNVGKSTLVNRLLDEKVSITSDKPQTTRHRIASVLTTEAHQLILLDIPGFQKPRDDLTNRMQARVEETLEEVDVVVFVLAADEEVGRGDAYIASYLRRASTPVVAALNKIDLVDADALEQCRRKIEALPGSGGFEVVLEISALTGRGTERLRKELVERLPVGPLYFPPGTVTDRPEEFLVAELIREKAIRLTDEEVPHATAVEILDAEWRRGGALLYVRALLVVERDSQRPILIGRGGERIKRIGSEARREIEALLGVQVYLDLSVKVRKRWRRDPAALERLGL